uniref:Tectonic-1-3 N-terminal domain-containing protein n=1 Tax=Pundamilia nyererei TaxID=303518 RepID=A0A3B4G2P3_9CICH
MAVTTVVKCDPEFFYLFLLLTVVTVNTTESDFNTTAFDAYNLIYNVTESYARTQPPASESTTTAPSYSTEMPNLPAVPLFYPSPPVFTDRLCPCDEQMDVCDINCCCDRVCSGDVPLFTSCSYPTVRYVEVQLKIFSFSTNGLQCQFTRIDFSPLGSVRYNK